MTVALKKREQKESKGKGHIKTGAENSYMGVRQGIAGATRIGRWKKKKKKILPLSIQRAHGSATP